MDGGLATAATAAVADIPAGEGSLASGATTVASGAATADSAVAEALVVEATAASATDLACLAWAFDLRQETVT